MNLNENMNLVLRVGEAYVHSTPISREVYQANFRILSLVKSELFDQGFDYAYREGPRIAALCLNDHGAKLAQKYPGAPNYAAALLLEIRRLSVFIGVANGAWDTLPVEIALRDKVIDEDDWAEVESNIVFFTCLYWGIPKRDRMKMIEPPSSFLGWSIVSLPPTDYAASLPGLTKAAPSIRAASSVPS